jgi:hypothetical protein
MDDLAPAIGTLGLLVLIAGGVMFLPVRALRGHRRLAKWMAIGGGIAFVVGILLTPATPHAPDASPADAKPAVTQQGATEKQEAEDQAATKREGFLTNYRATLQIAKGCDQSIDPVADAAKANDVIALYSAAKAGQEACQTAWLALGKIEAMSGDKEEKAVDTCKNAYFLRQRAMETAMAIADGDAKPSNVVSFTEDMKTGQAGVMLCVAQWMEAGGAIGVKPENMK